MKQKQSIISAYERNDVIGIHIIAWLDSRDRIIRATVKIHPTNYWFHYV